MTASTNFDKVLLFAWFCEQHWNNQVPLTGKVGSAEEAALACSDVPHPGEKRAEKANSWDVLDAFDPIWSLWGAHTGD